MELMDLARQYGAMVWTGVMTVMTMVVWPIIMALRERRREAAIIREQRNDDICQILIVGDFDGTIEFDCIGEFPTKRFRPHLAGVIVHWNDRPSDDLIQVSSDKEMQYLRGVVAMNTMAALFRAKPRCYLRKARRQGNEYRYVTFVACLIRPDFGRLTLQDCPRVLLIELSALERIMNNEADPGDDPDRIVLIDQIRQIAAARDQKQPCIVHFNIPIP